MCTAWLSNSCYMLCSGAGWSAWRTMWHCLSKCSGAADQLHVAGRLALLCSSTTIQYMQRSVLRQAYRSYSTTGRRDIHGAKLLTGGVSAPRLHEQMALLVLFDAVMPWSQCPCQYRPATLLHCKFRHWSMSCYLSGWTRWDQTICCKQCIAYSCHTRYAFKAASFWPFCTGFGMICCALLQAPASKNCACLRLGGRGSGSCCSACSTAVKAALAAMQCATFDHGAPWMRKNVFHRPISCAS